MSTAQFSFQDLEQFVDAVDAHLRSIEDNSEKERILARLAKLTEETGEVAEAVMATLKMQRKEKLEQFTSDDLESELADVILSVIVLARATNSDVRRALAVKTAKIKKRFNLE